jgi:hypothetical protein
MRHVLFVLLLSSISLTAQNFEESWEKVITLENAGKIKSANAQTEKILHKAEAKKNEPQIIKCFFLQIEIPSCPRRKRTAEDYQ